ncbi:MAG: protein kinase, partial [Myxococcales bacterium]|nr:protein kinase [Myxococcales bacterium]
MDAASAPGGPCPGEDTLLRYTQAALDASEHGPVASHVAGCERCRALVAALGTAPESDRPTERAPSRDVPAIGERVGKYRVERVLGAGGMGVVLAARHVELGSEVALKVMNLEGATSEDRARFAREARAAATLKSDHAARVHDVDTLPSGAPYMVMELLEGEDLAARVDRSGPLEPADVVAWMLQACDALAEAHERGVVHRDLKPQNLFLAERRGGAPPAVKVLDFGLAKVDDRGQREGDSLTRTSVFMGTPYYMAPEQVRSAKNVDARTDVWALGACMYTLLTGEPPFPGPNVGAICKGILEGAPRPLLDRRPDVSPGL